MNIVLEKLVQEWQQGNFFHAYLFVGNVGTVEEAISRFLSLSGAVRAEVTEVGPDSIAGKSGGIKVEQIRDLIHSINLTNEKRKLAVIWSTDLMNNSAANSLLKSLEEPPQNVVFFLQATNLSLPLTIKSRCRVVRLNSEKTDRNTFSYDIDFSDNLLNIFKTIENVVKNNETDPYLEELVFLIRDDMIKTNDAGLALALGKIEQTRKRIAGNANPRLALESLTLFIKEIYGRNIF